MLSSLEAAVLSSLLLVVMRLLPLLLLLCCCRRHADVIEGEDAEADQEHQVLTAALQSVLAEHEREQQQGQQGQGDKAEGKGKKGQQEARDKGKKDAAAAAGKKPAWQGEEAQDPGERVCVCEGGGVGVHLEVLGIWAPRVCCGLAAMSVPAGRGSCRPARGNTCTPVQETGCRPGKAGGWSPPVGGFPHTHILFHHVSPCATTLPLRRRRGRLPALFQVRGLP